MPEGGNIKIRAENINVVEKDSLPLLEGSYVKITVEDHGTGISQEHLQRIFDPYFTTKQDGSGLGLATAYSIVKRHDGHITVESETGFGTTFHIYLPASQKEIPKEPVTRKVDELDNKHLEKKNAGKPAASKGRILVMDDEYTIRNILCKHLSVLKYEAEAVGEGSEVIRLYKDASKAGNPFDAVIMDLTVPGGMGGKETIKKLLEIDPAVKAIVSSGYANDPIMVNHLKYGFKGALVKPHEIHELDETLQKVIALIK
jgi:CheY-like chemotaxis protein